MKKLTTEEFIKRSEVIHNFKYLYHLSVYGGLTKKIIIVCPAHGEFLQTPREHMDGCGCSKCANKYIDTPLFIEKAIKFHGNKYLYNLIDYKNSHTHVKIICQKHGEFLQSPSNHLSGKGCPVCARDLCGVGVNEKKYFIPFMEEYWGKENIKKQYKIPKTIYGNYFVDFVIEREKLIIEYDEKHHKYKKVYDKERQSYIENKTGFKVIRVKDELFMGEGKSYFEELLNK